MTILVASIAALYFAREIFLPLAFALVLALLLTSPVGWMQRAGLGRVPSVMFAMLITLAATVGIAWVMAGQLLDVAGQLPNYKQNIHAKIAAMSTPGKGALSRAAESVESIGSEFAVSAPSSGVPDATAPFQVQPPLREPAPVQIVNPPANRLQYLRDALQPFVAPFATGFMVLIFTAFLLIEREDLRNRMLRLVGLSQLNVMTQALDDATRRVSRYLLLQVLVNAAFGTLFSIGLYLIGVPYAALWGATAAVLRFVPYIGTLLAAVLPLILSLAVFDGWGRPAMVFGVYLALETLTANVVEPLLYGAHTGISSLAILVSSIFWAIIWGPAGLILATPLTVCVVVLGRYVPQFSFLHILLGDEPVLVAEAQLYQRLLAMDSVEGRRVVDQFLKGRSLVELYDSVMIPALTMAEQDRHKEALDPAREEFIFLSVGEMVAEFSTVGDRLPDGHAFGAGRVLVLPASDAADEIVGAMLSQLLEQAGIAVVSFPVCASFHDLLTILQPDDQDVICISSLPPFAFAHARDLCRQVRARFPRSQIVAGIWGFTGDPEEALRRFERPGPNHITASLSKTLELLSKPQVRDSENGLLESQPVG